MFRGLLEGTRSSRSLPSHKCMGSGGEATREYGVVFHENTVILPVNTFPRFQIVDLMYWEHIFVDTISRPAQRACGGGKPNFQIQKDLRHLKLSPETRIDLVASRL